jgi:hypothetical protein
VESLKKQNELLAEIHDIKKLLSQVLSSPVVAAAPTIWPLKSLEQLKQAEEHLKNPNNFAAEVQFIILYQIL